MNRIIATVLLTLLSLSISCFSQDKKSAFYLEQSKNHVRDDANLFNRKERNALESLLSNDSLQGEIYLITYEDSLLTAPYKLPDSLAHESFHTKNGSLVILFNTAIQNYKRLRVYDFLKDPQLITPEEYDFIYDKCSNTGFKNTYTTILPALKEIAHLMKDKNNTPLDYDAFNKMRFYYYQDRPEMGHNSDLYIPLRRLRVSPQPIDSLLPGLKSISKDFTFTLTTEQPKYKSRDDIPDTLYYYYIKHEFVRHSNKRINRTYYSLESRLHVSCISGKDRSFKTWQPQKEDYHFFHKSIREKLHKTLKEDRYRILKETFGMEYNLDTLLSSCTKIHVQQYGYEDESIDTSLVFSNETVRIDDRGDQFQTITGSEVSTFAQDLISESKQSRSYDEDCFIGTYMLYFEGPNNTYLGNVELELGCPGFGYELIRDNYTVKLGGAFLNDVSYIKIYLDDLFNN
jgi:hypothetical protein